MLAKPLNYRAEIDGIRALAVVSVILYHAQVILLGRDWFKGGYIGVDIFFVISGYLITRIILSELRLKGSFSFFNFYERRARRILPMLFFVIFVSVPFVWYALLPSELVEYAQSILAALFFGSNFFFYSVTTEYGAESSLLKPFLHTWSLGVEEQFYLLFPILALIIFKFFRAYFFIIIVTLSVASLLLSALVEVQNPNLNFFLPFSRFWELAVGAILASRELDNKKNKDGVLSRVLPTLGLCLVTYAILFFDDKTPHPSFHTIIPVLGVALLIGWASKDELVGRVLGSRPLVWIGLVSYSAYLWHFPIFAITRARDSSLSNYDKFELILLTFALSFLSLWLIEKPIRLWVPRRLFLVLTSVSATILILPMSYVSFHKDFNGNWFKYAPSSLVVPYTIIRDTQVKPKVVTDYCRFNVFKNPEFDIKSRMQDCRKRFGRAVFIQGDSHASNLFNSFVLSERYPFIVGSHQGSCRPHGCFMPDNHYVYFLKNLIPLTFADDLIIFHQSGSHLVKDRTGQTDSQRAFDEGAYSIDREKIHSVARYLVALGRSTTAKVVWLGPFLEYRFNPKDIVELARKNEPFERYLTVNTNSRIIFDKLESSLSKITSNLFTYLPFSSFYKVDLNAQIMGVDNKICFQFKDRDHFSECGEKAMAHRANFSFSNP